jgi:hypothetical protein
MNNTDTPNKQLADANTLHRINSSSEESAFPSDIASSNDAGSQQRVSTIREDEKQDGAPGTVNVTENEEETTTTRWKGINMKAVHVIYVMPFFATIATRLPLIYFAIYLVEDLEVSLVSVGWFVAAYQAARTLTIFADMFYPKAAHLFGTTAGLLGFLALLIKKEHDQLGIFAACNIVVGLAESSAAVQIYAKRDFATDMSSLRYALRTQSAVNGVAVIFGFLFGGVMFQAFGVAGVAGTGVIVLGVELLSLVMYIISDHGNDNSASDKNEGMDTGFPSQSDNKSENEVESLHKGAKSPPPSCSGPKPSNDLSSTHNQILLRSAISTGNVPDALLNRYSASTEIARNNILFVVAAAFTIESVTVGYLFSIGPLFIKTEFGKGEGAIGLLFSAASLWGTILTIFFASTKGQAFCRKYLPSPYNLYAFLCTIATFMTITSVPLFSVHVISILFVVGGNELFLTVLTEIQGEHVLCQLPANCSAPAYSIAHLSPKPYPQGPSRRSSTTKFLVRWRNWYADFSISSLPSQGLCFLTSTQGCRSFCRADLACCFHCLSSTRLRSKGERMLRISPVY